MCGPARPARRRRIEDRGIAERRALRETLQAGRSAWRAGPQQGRGNAGFGVPGRSSPVPRPAQELLVGCRVGPILLDQIVQQQRYLLVEVRVDRLLADNGLADVVDDALGDRMCAISHSLAANVSHSLAALCQTLIDRKPLSHNVSQRGLNRFGMVAAQPPTEGVAGHMLQTQSHPRISFLNQ